MKQFCYTAFGKHLTVYSGATEILHMYSRPTNWYNKEADTIRPLVPHTQFAALIFSAVQHNKAALGWVVLTPPVQWLLWVSCTTNNTTNAHVVLKWQVRKHFAVMHNDNCLRPAFVHEKHERNEKQSDRAGRMFSTSKLMLNCFLAISTSRSHFLILDETHSCQISKAPHPGI